MNGSTTQSKLKGELSTRQIFSLGFGTIIGVGWVIVLGEWLGQAGPVGAAGAFLAGGLLMVMVGLCYAEMASLIPASGGEVAYTYEVFGAGPCFAVGWLLLLVWVATTTFEAISVGWIASALVPASEGPALYWSLGAPVHLGSLLLGLGGMLLLTLLNYRGAKEAARFQEILTLILIVAAAGFVAAGIGWGSVTHLRPFFGENVSGSALTGMLAVFVAAPFWLGGFSVIPQVMEERAPGTSSRLAARMIVLSIALAAAFYALVILSAAMTTPWRDLLDLELPAAGAFQIAVDSPVMAKVVLGVALLGLITTWNAVFIAGSRVLFALGRARLLPAWFSRVHPVHGTPGHGRRLYRSTGFGGNLSGAQRHCAHRQCRRRRDVRGLSGHLPGGGSNAPKETRPVKPLQGTRRKRYGLGGGGGLSGAAGDRLRAAVYKRRERFSTRVDLSGCLGRARAHPVGDRSRHPQRCNRGTKKKPYSGRSGGVR